MEVQVLSRAPDLMKHHVIYVPGIADDKLKVQSILLYSWWLYGVHPHLHEMPWAGSGHFEPKLERLLALIDKHHAKGHAVSLIGASAGASAVLHAYDKRREAITGVVYVCGKINRPESVSDRTYTANLAFKEALYSLQKVLPLLTPDHKARLFSLYSPADRSVPHEDTIIEGVKERRLHPLSHSQSILFVLSVGALLPIRFLKRAAQQM